MGNFCKIFLKFDNTFWDTEKQYIFIMNKKKGFYPLWKNAGHNMLWGFVCAEEALRVEKLDSE